MAFVNKSGGDGEQESTDVAAGAPPAFDVDFDPNDPNQIKVHYDLTGWSLDQRAELAETLAELEVPHIWDAEELIVPEAIEQDVDGLFDRLESEIGPFPVPLLDDDGSTEFGLDEWPFRDIETLKQALVEAEIPHAWQGRTLLVAGDAEDVVDTLLDAIEAGEVASFDGDAEAPEGALHNLYVAADRLARDATHGPFAVDVARSGPAAVAHRATVRPRRRPLAGGRRTCLRAGGLVRVGRRTRVDRGRRRRSASRVPSVRVTSAVLARCVRGAMPAGRK